VEANSKVGSAEGGWDVKTKETVHTTKDGNFETMEQFSRLFEKLENAGVRKINDISNEDSLKGIIETDRGPDWLGFAILMSVTLSLFLTFDIWRPKLEAILDGNGLIGW